jgi:F0F1-type ATP synthase assembly protein I
MARQDEPHDEKPKPENSGGDESQWGVLATLGFEIGAGAGLGALLGVWIDKKCHTAPWGVVAGTFLGIGSGMYLLIKEALKANKD